jgi:hypothetical protein
MSNKKNIYLDDLDYEEEVLYDSEGYLLNNIELEIDDFGYYDFKEGDDKKYKKKTDTRKYCKFPQDHKFNKKLLFYSHHRECAICGYSPELDSGKKEFEECHSKFINWEKNKK